MQVATKIVAPDDLGRAKDAWLTATHHLVGVLDHGCKDATWARLAELPAPVNGAQAAIPADLRRAAQVAVRALPQVKENQAALADAVDMKTNPIRNLTVARLGGRTYAWMLTSAMGTCGTAERFVGSSRRELLDQVLLSIGSSSMRCSGSTDVIASHERAIESISHQEVIVVAVVVRASPLPANQPPPAQFTR